MWLPAGCVSEKNRFICSHDHIRKRVKANDEVTAVQRVTTVLG